MIADNALRVLVAGKDPNFVQGIMSMLNYVPNVRASTQVIKTGDDFPWVGGGAMPEALILALHSEALIPEPVRMLGDLSSSERPATLVVGSGFDIDAVRFAMYCGARDVLDAPVESGDLIAALDRIASERSSSVDRRGGQLTVVVGAKGGAGASFIASNLAHTMLVNFREKVVLVDMDLQYSVQPLYFDLHFNDGLLQAVETVGTLDEVAVEGCVLTHDSGLHILANSHNQLILPGELSEAGVADLLQLLKRSYGQVVVDLPRQIDPVFSAVVAQADQIVVVLDQSLAGLKHAKKLTTILTSRLGFLASQIQFVINRWDKKASLTLKDIKQVLNGTTFSTLPSDVRRVTQSLEGGKPLIDGDSRAPISRELSALTSRLIGRAPEKKGLIARFIRKAA